MSAVIGSGGGDVVRPTLVACRLVLLTARAAAVFRPDEETAAP
ncbi:MAG TPA: hypothetical protein VEJ37_04350 [Xanthobacteraceae bacterium]|nr:hypothetical protein [Xanthobacteraceae bacterium]